ncbi:MAG: ABC-2 family transporter protein [Candidatus Nanoarchaeia archaeon]|nr:ABC-2 family transporter protein [Candidatus Nanoarchaeia archaeon]
MNKYIDVLVRHILMDFSEFFSHKQATFFQFFADFFEFFLQPLLLYFIYNISSGFQGWEINEMFFLIATARISLSLAGSSVLGIVFSNLWRLKSGNFHQVLLKPFNTIIYMIIGSFNAYWIMDITSGFLLLIYSIIKLKIQITLLGTLSYFYLIFISLLCYYGIAGILMNFFFKNPRSENILDIFWTASRFSNYPLNIFPNVIKFILTFIFPIALSSYYPASYFLSKSADYSLIIVFSIIGLAFAIIGSYAIKDGVKNHVSFGG